MIGEYTLHLPAQPDRFVWTDEAIASMLTNPDVKVTIGADWTHLVGRGHFRSARRAADGGVMLTFVPNAPSVPRLHRVWVGDYGIDPELPVRIGGGFHVEHADPRESEEKPLVLRAVRFHELHYDPPPEPSFSVVTTHGGDVVRVLPEGGQPGAATILGSDTRVYTAPLGVPLDPSSWTEVGQAEGLTFEDVEEHDPAETLGSLSWQSEATVTLPPGQPSVGVWSLILGNPDPLATLRRTMTTSSRNWADDGRDAAALYGIVVGWDDAWPMIQERYGLSDEEVQATATLHAMFTVLLAEEERRVHPVAEDTEDGQANTCAHSSATGVDTAPMDGAKVWRCDHCGMRWTTSGGVPYTDADLDRLREALRREEDSAYAGGSTVGLSAVDAAGVVVSWLTGDDR